MIQQKEQQTKQAGERGNQKRSREQMRNKDMPCLWKSLVCIVWNMTLSHLIMRESFISDSPAAMQRAQRESPVDHPTVNSGNTAGHDTVSRIIIEHELGQV